MASLMASFPGQPGIHEAISGSSMSWTIANLFAADR